jgi:protein-S-isoprenylcysteine O-methyltransferase Ste14
MTACSHLGLWIWKLGPCLHCLSLSLNFSLSRLRSSPRCRRGRLASFVRRCLDFVTMRILLAIRALLFVVLFPGMVAGYVPYRLLISSHHLTWPRLSVSTSLATLVVVVGVSTLLWGVWEFFSAGRGTLAPIDPPKSLVVTGLYRFTRTPMYNGVVGLLLGQAWLFSSILILNYTLIVAACFHLFVVFYEEPTLKSQFGEAYQAYRRIVPRWGFIIHPFHGP